MEEEVAEKLLNQSLILFRSGIANKNTCHDFHNP